MFLTSWQFKYISIDFFIVNYNNNKITYVCLFNFIGKRLGFLPVSRPCKNNEHTYK